MSRCQTRVIYNEWGASSCSAAHFACLLHKWWWRWWMECRSVRCRINVIRKVSGRSHTRAGIQTRSGFPLGGVVKTIGCRYGNATATGGKWYPFIYLSHSDEHTNLVSGLNRCCSLVTNQSSVLLGWNPTLTRWRARSHARARTVSLICSCGADKHSWLSASIPVWKQSLCATQIQTENRVTLNVTYWQDNLFVCSSNQLFISLCFDSSS